MSDPLNNLDHDPERLLHHFNRPILHIIICFVVAFFLHVLVVGGSSYGYVRDRWIDPEGAKLREKARLEAQKAKEDAEKKKITDAAAEGAKEDTKTEEAAETDGDDGDDDGEKKSSIEKQNEELRKKYGGETIKKITEMPKEGEIPDEPQGEKPLDDELGIGFGETNQTLDDDNKNPTPGQ